MTLSAGVIQEFKWQEEHSARPNIVLSLHACDTATDDVISFGIKNQADLIAVVPCCQAELAKLWSAHPGAPLSFIKKTSFFRRKIASEMTDVIRVLLLRSFGYEVSTFEFTDASHTPKNLCIIARRRGKYHRPSYEEYQKLKEEIGPELIGLERDLLDNLLKTLPQ